jgi:DNA primase
VSTQSKLVYLLDRVIGSKGQKLKRQNEYMYWSPFISHHKPKLQINLSGKWHCWVSNQGGHNLFQLFKKLSATKEQFDELREIVGDSNFYSSNQTDKVDERVELPKEFKPLWNGNDNIVKGHALNYLYKRGLSDNDILKYNIGYCDSGLYSNRIIVPSYDENGQLNFFVGRDFYNSKMKYRNSPTTKDVIGFELFINWDEPIILVEGVMDAITFRRNAIPLFGKSVMNLLKKKIIESNVKIIYLALDTDAISDSVKIAEYFMDNGIIVKLMSLDEKDPNECGFQSLLYLIQRTNETNFLDLMKLRLNGKPKRHVETLR